VKGGADLRGRFLDAGTGALGDPVELPFRIDDLIVNVPAFGDALVVQLREHFRPDFVPYVAPPPGVSADVPLRVTVDGQSATLEWDRNPAVADRGASVAWVQRLPDAEWLACTPGTTLTDPAPPPGKSVYMIAWRNGARLRAAVRGTRVAVADVPDVAPGKPRVVTLEAGDARVALWARSAPAADLGPREWQRRAEGGDWETIPGAQGLLLHDSSPAGARPEFRVRVLDAAGNASPFSDPVRARP